MAANQFGYDPTVGSLATNLAINQAGAQGVADMAQNAQNYQINEMKIDAAKSAQEAAQQFNQELSQAGGDPTKLQALALKYPSQAESIGKALGVQDQARATALNSAVGDLTLASRVGTDQAMAAAISKHRDLISSMGSTPQELFQTWKANPQQFQQIVNAAGMATVPYQKQQEIDAQNYRTDATLRGQDLDYRSQAENRAVQREGLDIRRGDQAISRETNEVTRQATRAKIAESEQKQYEAQRAILDDYSAKSNLLQQNLEAAQAITGPIAADGTYDKSSPQFKQFESLFNPIGWAKKKFPGTKEAGMWANVQGLQAQARQTGVQALKGGGSVSDADAKAAQESLLAIQENTDPEQAKGAINRYLNTLQRAQRGLNSPQKLREVSQARASIWGQQRGVAPRAVQMYIEAKAKGTAGVDEQWREAFPGIEPPKPEDF